MKKGKKTEQVRRQEKEKGEETSINCISDHKKTTKKKIRRAKVLSLTGHLADWVFWEDFERKNKS